MNRPPAGPTHAKDQRKIVWDESNAPNVYSDVSTVSATREEISLLFGTSQVPEKGNDAIPVQVTDRVVLAPSLAKSLAVALGDCIRNLEAPLGILDEPFDLPVRRIQFPKVEIKSEKAELIFPLVKELNVKLIFERSVKLAERSLLGNRFLIGVNKKLIDGKPDERILSICEKMAMPAELLGTFSRDLPEVNYVYFGFEEKEKTATYKAYLESPEYWERVTPNSLYGSEPFLLYKGFKWDASDRSKRALTRYTCYPCITQESIFKRLSILYEDCPQGDSLVITRRIVEAALGRTAYENLVYLEVGEDDNPRKSFDIGLYKAKLHLEELFPFLLEMCRHFSIPLTRFHALFDPVRSEPFGHLSGGIDREGKEFLTVYYGVEHHPKDSLGRP